MTDLTSITGINAAAAEAWADGQKAAASDEFKAGWAVVQGEALATPRLGLLGELLYGYRAELTEDMREVALAAVKMLGAYHFFTFSDTDRAFGVHAALLRDKGAGEALIMESDPTPDARFVTPPPPPIPAGLPGGPELPSAD